MTRVAARTILTLACAFAAVPAAHAEIAVRITDLYAGTGSGVPNLDAVVFAGKLYFAGTTDNSDTDLWVYDGVSPATMVPGGNDLEPLYLTVWQGALYFQGGPPTDRELWRYDGVNPPVEAIDIYAAGNSDPANLTAFGPELCFGAYYSDAVGEELVCWDGATAPDVYELRAGQAGGQVEELTVIGSTLYFDGIGDGVGSEPWAYQNFFAPTLLGDLLPGPGSSQPESFVQVGPKLYLRASDPGGVSRVWSDDGVAPPAMVSSTFRVQGGLASWNGRLLVDGHDDGEALGGFDQVHMLRGGVLVPLIWAGGSNPSARSFVAHRNALYFRSTPSQPAGDLFRHCGDGTIERVTDQFAGTEFIEGVLTVFQGRIFFTGKDTATGRELWAVDPLTALFCGGFEDGNDDDWSSSMP